MSTGDTVLSQNRCIPFSLQHICSLPIVLGQANGPALPLFLAFLVESIPGSLGSGLASLLGRAGSRGLWKGQGVLCLFQLS